ncbi:hypothetical protein INT43_004474 [Umbelopsis isabellina]|uniref:Large ribosomal subunit protein mL50 n=1 Tax=Mortierella isabellina TaxID=91625 RepID=A0A8H7PGZ1_MORIS|nr:hypothetical protein INT43_004474 [Umbelopsis isabellina]
MIRSSLAKTYPLLQTRCTAALHTSAAVRIANTNAIGASWNPFAKKQEQEQKPDQPLQDAVNKVDLDFNIDYEDKIEVPSWKNATIINDVEQVQSILKQVVQKHIHGASDSNWTEASLADVNVKFNVIKDAIIETGKDVPNAELNNIESVSDALAFFSRKSVLPDDARGAVQRYLEEDVEELPSNLSFHKREKFRIES